MREIEIVKHVPFFLIGSLLALLGAGSAQRQESGRQLNRQILLPDEETTIAPCCPSGPEYDRFPPVPTREIASPPPGRPVDDRTYQRLKELAGFDPNVPDGRDAGTAEDGEAPGLIEELIVPLAPDKRSQFNGVNQEKGGGFPPDTNIAVGPGHLLEAVNFVFRLSTKANGNALFQTFNDHFGTSSKAFLFDPKVYYDPISERFFVVVLELDDAKDKSFIYLSVSRDREPSSLASGWCNYKFSSKRKRAYADYPQLGMNEKWLAIGTNNFKFSGGFFERSHLWVIDKTELVDNASGCPQLSLFKFTAATDADGELAFNVQPAQHYTDTGLPGDTLFLVSTPFSSSDVYVLWRLQSSSPAAGGRAAKTKPTLSRSNLAATPFSLPPLAAQKGKGVPLDSGDTRVMQQVVFRDNKLWFAFATGCNLGGGGNESCIRVARIIPDAAAGTVDFEDTFGAGKNNHIWWPGLAVNQRGDVVVVFQRSGKKTFLSVAYNGMKKGASKFDTIKFLARGKCSSQAIGGGGFNRTGDYVGAQPDPSNNRQFWIAGEFSKRFGSHCDWFTKIAKVSY
ncbi:MAG: hypothetical protein ACE5HV_00320 [Acidobacteriota bacterium]